MTALPRVIIFGLEETLTTTKSGQQVPIDPDDWQFLPGRRERCQQLVAEGHKLAIVANQGKVVALHGFNEDRQRAQNRKVGRIIGASIVMASFTDSAGREDYWAAYDYYRLPEPGMLVDAMKLLSFKANEAVVIAGGQDQEITAQAAAAAGIRFMNAQTVFVDEDERVG